MSLTTSAAGDRAISRRSKPPKPRAAVPILGASEVLVVSGSRYDRINAIGSRQRGRITRGQLMAALITPAQVRTLVEHGYLRRRGHGVYAIGHEAPIPLAAETEALLVAGPGAGISHAHSGALWGMCPAPGGLVHLTSRRERRCRDIVVHRSRLLTSDDVVVREGLAVTSPAWTLLDLAGMDTFGTRRLEWAFDHALVHRLMRPADLTELLDRVKGSRKGVERLRGLLAADGPSALTRSEAEELFLAIVRGAGLPAPQVNARRDGWELDFLWADAGVVAEIDGFRFHSSPASFERDRAKDAALRSHGLTVVRFSWRQVSDEPLLVAAQLGRLLAGAG
ncbi:MAG TPA: type IV toxin-antitoxin system AbiEi family antitoxin domain-containing protein [Solirubrobacteraceae bacterium]|nr:type IV toxin-antitoxin system AbiEi family antitoxin domain-containing protein [Solirubrobacteraceae bacterium]